MNDIRFINKLENPPAKSFPFNAFGGEDILKSFVEVT